MFSDETMNDNMEMFLSFFCMVAIYFTAYTLIKRNKTEEKDIKNVKWVAFGISLVVVGIGKVVMLPN